MTQQLDEIFDHYIKPLVREDRYQDVESAKHAILQHCGGFNALMYMLPSRTRKLEYDEDTEKWRCWTMPYSIEAFADTPEEAVKMVIVGLSKRGVKL